MADRTARFEVFPDEDGEYRWRLRAANGEIVASSEGYRDRTDARRGVHDLLSTALATITNPITGTDSLSLASFGITEKLVRIVDVDA